MHTDGITGIRRDGAHNGSGARVYYHGTVESSVEGILRDGLRAEDGLKWQALPLNYFAAMREETFAQQEMGQPFVYLTELKTNAIDFAKLRAAYLRADGSTAIQASEIGTVLYKVASAPMDLSAAPALIRVTLPADWPLEEDLGQEGAWKSARAIPAMMCARVRMEFVHERPTVIPMSVLAWQEKTTMLALEQMLGRAA